MNNITILRKHDWTKGDALVQDLYMNPAKGCTTEEAEELAEKVLKAWRLDNANCAIPIVKIANGFGFACHKAENIPEDISGNIFVGGTTKEVYGNDKVIIVGSSEAYEHQRFIIAHELGHYLIDYIGSSESKDSGILFSRTYPKQNHQSDEECRADRFAAELLMPSKIFLRQYVRAMEAFDYNKKYVISHLSAYFKTKKSSIQRRIDELII